MSLTPELFAGQPCAFRHRLEFGPDNLRLYLVVGPSKSSEPAIRPCDNVFLPHQRGVSDDALGYQLGKFDVVGGGVQHTGDDDFAVGKFDVLEHFPFVLMPGIGCLEGEGLRPGFEHRADDFLHGDVPVMGPS